MTLYQKCFFFRSNTGLRSKLSDVVSDVELAPSTRLFVALLDNVRLSTKTLRRFINLYKRHKVKILIRLIQWSLFLLTIFTFRLQIKHFFKLQECRNVIFQCNFEFQQKIRFCCKNNYILYDFLARPNIFKEY